MTPRSSQRKATYILTGQMDQSQAQAARNTAVKPVVKFPNCFPVIHLYFTDTGAEEILLFALKPYYKHCPMYVLSNNSTRRYPGKLLLHARVCSQEILLHVIDTV
jgi:hypothetical protein